jgi:4'-phosphopantetheinyl transferase
MGDVRDPAALWLWCQLTDTCADSVVEAGLEGLSVDERTRAARFLFAHDRRDYVLSHALLRQLVAARQGSAACCAIDAEPHGKPVVVEAPGVHITLSHARGCVACAAADEAVGVDVEPLSRWSDIQHIASACLADSERELLRRCGDSERPMLLVDLWTLKEATAKALGLGLAMPMRDLAFRFEGAGIEAAFTAADARWQFAIFAPDPRYRVASAVRQHTVGPAAIAAQCLVSGEWRSIRPVRASPGYAIDAGAGSAATRP